MAKLGDICTFQSGGTPSKSVPSYYQGNIPWITTVSLNSGKIGDESAVEHITDKAISESAAKIVPQNSIMVGTRVGVGKVAINTIPMSTSQDIISLLNIDEMAWDKDFICKFIVAKHEYLNSQARGATIKGIKIDTLAGLELPMLTLEEQRHISNVLNGVSQLISLRKDQLKELDQLVKSRFIELFGDPILNTKKWKTKSVESVCKEIYGGGTPSKSHPEYYENGDIPWVSSKDMKTDILYDSQIHINQLGVNNSTAKLVPVGSVIMVIRSGILKHTLPVAINAVPITVNQDLKVFIPGVDVRAMFLMYQFKLLEKDILSGVRAVTADNIEFNSLKQREIAIPPMDLQNEFVAFIEQTDKLKLAVTEALAELETLKKSLMQEYFG